MLRTRLLSATAAVALFAAGSAFAQTAPASPMAPSTTPPVAAEEPAETPVAAPAQDAATAASATPAPAAAIQNNVVDVLRANGQFTTLLGALDAAQLTETLSTQPAISIFAPTDAAFAALSEADRTRLLDPANVNELRQLLLYHVVVADVQSSQIEGAKGGVQTAATTEVQLDGTGDAIKVDNATVTTADIDAGNGAVFIIDRVLNPADSLVANGDAEEATTATPAADDTATATPPTDEVTPPAADSATADSMGADSAMDEGAVAPPPTTPAAPAPAAAAPTVPTMTPAPTTPAVPSPTTASPTATTTTTRPATGVNAPNGQPAATTTTLASPTVPNPTDGQADDEDADETPTPAPVPTPQA
ncbi:fasciclin domain-containing protein [Brevundimonas sp.]|uniref:fasciclin domain-containing protein n=1 Tax=Brevundimonas sp. TaxID=1871086 RepID=UPI003D125903